MVGYSQHKQRGAASIFVVSFFVLLITVITFSFVNIVIQDQQQSTNNDLAQSAYDSASAGAEDAQRVLRWYNKNCAVIPPAVVAPDKVSDCDKIKIGEKCNMSALALKEGILPGTKYDSSGEVKLEQNESDSALEQAYSCVGVQTQTTDYQSVLRNQKNDTLIPLKTVNNQPFDKIEVSWYMVGGSSPDVKRGGVMLPNVAGSAGASLPKSNADGAASPAEKWGKGRPPIIRIQIIPTQRGAIDIADMNRNTRTLFLYASQQGVTDFTVLGSDSDRDEFGASTKDNSPQIVRCNSSADDGQYVCQANLTGLNFPDGADGSNTDFFVRVSSIYTDTQFRMRLFNTAVSVTEPVKLDNVSPRIDSTGRANDVYRRVQSRVITPSSESPVTDGGFDITQGLCKDFQVPEYRSDCPTTAPRLDQD